MPRYCGFRSVNITLGCIAILVYYVFTKNHISESQLLRERPNRYINTIPESLAEDLIIEKTPRPSISLCIPAIPRDLDSGCIFRVVQSARLQTVPPAEIIIALSNSTYEFGLRARSLLRRSAGHIPLRVIRASELHFQATSRNNAIIASSGDIISFIDADDEMHPNRLEIIQHMFAREKRLKMFLHGYTEGHDLKGWRHGNLSFTSGNLIGKEELCKSEARTRHQPHLDLLVHHAHLSLRQNMLGGFHFDESEASYRNEDSLFVRDILVASCTVSGSEENILFLDSPLSYYETSETRKASCTDERV